VLNTIIPISKQIFAAAHELYHIRCFLEENDPELARSGSILESHTIDAGTTEEEEMEANAFAGVLLASVDDLNQQMRIFRIEKSDIGIDDILTLMDIFAIPYKAMVLRLMEESIISIDKAKALLGISAADVKKRQLITGKAKRWMIVPKGNEKLGSIVENISINTYEENLPESRLKSDWDRVETIKKRYGIE
jgi:Zn-dependent peptidase ImmA (M78 family)